jgi:hypothetical protein
VETGWSWLRSEATDGRPLSARCCDWRRVGPRGRSDLDADGLALLVRKLPVTRIFEEEGEESSVALYVMR